MSRQTRFKMHKLEAEQNLLRSIPDTYPVIRDGRGGGGWQFCPGKLLSTHEEKLVPIEPGSDRVRRDVLHPLGGVSAEEAQADLYKMLGPKFKVSRSPTPPPQKPGKRARRSSSRTQEVVVYPEMAVVPPKIVSPPQTWTYNPLTYAAAPASASLAKDAAPPAKRETYQYPPSGMRSSSQWSISFVPKTQNTSRGQSIAQQHNTTPGDAVCRRSHIAGIWR